MVMGMQQTRNNLVEEGPIPSSVDDRYKTLFERINAAAFLTTLEGQIQEANQKSYDYLGYEWNELLRLTLQDILSKDLDWVQLREDLAARGCVSMESETVCKNGTQFPVDVDISIFRMNGTLVMFVLLWDITERKKQEKRLKESEKKYHGLFEYTTDGIFVLDAHGDILDINTRMCEILDVMKSTVLNKNLFNMDLLTARSLPIVIQQFEQLLSEKIAGSYTTEIKNRKGKILEVEISSFFLVKKDNEVDNFVLIVRDITARNESKQKRLEEYELLHTLMDNISDLVYIKDEQHRFIIVNKAMAAEFDVDPEKMIGKTEFDFISKEHVQQSVDDENAIMQSGHSIINRLECIDAYNGSKRWISLTKIPRYNEEGTIVGTIGFSRNVTLWKDTEEEFVINQEILQTLMDSIPDCVSFKDTQNRFILVNKQLANSFMVTPERMIGKTDFDFMPQDLAQKACAQDNQILQTGNSIVNSLEKIKDAAGNERLISITKVPRYDSKERIIGTLSLSRNINNYTNAQEMKPQ